MTDKEKLKELEELKRACMYSKDNYTDEDRKVLCDGCEEKCAYAIAGVISTNAQVKKEPVSEPQVTKSAKTQHVKETCKENGDSLTQEPVSEELEKAGKEWLKPQLDKSYANYGEAKMMELTHFDGYAMLDAIEFGANWQKQKDSIPVSEDYEKALNSVAITFLQEQQIVPNFYADIIMKAVKRGANWQKGQMMKEAVDAKITLLDGISYVSKDVLSQFKQGDKVKVIVIKENWEL